VALVTCPRFFYQSKLEFPWVYNTPFVTLRTPPLRPHPSSFEQSGAPVKDAPFRRAEGNP